MRLLLVGFALAGISLFVSTAVALAEKNPYTQYRYASCRCYFGPTDSAPTCVAETSCTSEGGRCGRKCPAQTGY